MTPREATELLQGWTIDVVDEGPNWLLIARKGKQVRQVILNKDQVPDGWDMYRHAEITFANMLLSQKKYTHGR